MTKLLVIFWSSFSKRLQLELIRMSEMALIM